MVIGFESFREHFIGYDDCYTVIGGAACDVLMKQASLEFRATKDVDIILIVEDRFPEFAVVFYCVLHPVNCISRRTARIFYLV